MTTISDMLAPRPASGTRSTDALSLSRAEGPSAFADVLDDVVEDGGRSRPETVTRREQERGPDKQDASVERSRAGQEDEETEATSSSREGDEDAAASDREDEEAYVPMGDASHVPQEPDSGEQVEGEIAPARQAPLWQRTGAQES
ncbi:MAG: hypothetical protein HOH74_24230, partial [Gemmatimonadetes bacterium]|nr:hypothetical protein [Gemmatimonadota bacterium]